MISKEEAANAEVVNLQVVDQTPTAPSPTYNISTNSNVNTDTENPPEYSDHADPPSYNSLFGKIKCAQEESTGKVDYVRRVLVMLLCGSICCGIWIAFLLAVPIAALVVGVLFLNQCPRERFIPIYLVVFGCVGIVKALANVVQMICNKKKGVKADDPNDSSNKKPNPVDAILNCFMTAWFIAGCVWIYRVHGDYQSEDPELSNYCHRTVFIFAFWLQTSQFILLGAALLLCCCTCIVMCCVAAKSS